MTLGEPCCKLSMELPNNKIMKAIML